MAENVFFVFKLILNYTDYTKQQISLHTIMRIESNFARNKKDNNNRIENSKAVTS